MFAVAVLVCALLCLRGSAAEDYFGEILASESVNWRKFEFFELQGRPVRSKSKNYYKVEESKCSWLDRTERSPFVVFILLKTSGHFMGMGTILDSRTVLTAGEAIASTFKMPNRILVLAGCLSPWWAKNSQVRHVDAISAHEYELVLLEINRDWRLCKTVRPLHLMRKLERNLEKTYGKELGVFGIPTSTYFTSGDQMPKTTTYYFSAHTCTEENDCGNQYLDLKPTFNDSVHSCLFANGSYCYGCLGSPVVGVTKDEHIELVGVVIRSSCLFFPRHVLMLKLYPFDAWIRSFSLIGHQLPGRW